MRPRLRRARCRTPSARSLRGRPLDEYVRWTWLHVFTLMHAHASARSWQASDQDLARSWQAGDETPLHHQLGCRVSDDGATMKLLKRRAAGLTPHISTWLPHQRRH
ncbi:hypothetical protein PVAP13_6KG137624 [Panicum virgatum]|uniref:Uncharacterized protein n=1 Tax=Panicum virgatum TaxID=38727 RepID=A0A8T0RBT0_PANVG|nr:hypothetical protein PVAP13_6KG137624 [Panicum virgatum]